MHVYVYVCMYVSTVHVDREMFTIMTFFVGAPE